MTLRVVRVSGQIKAGVLFELYGGLPEVSSWIRLGGKCVFSRMSREMERESWRVVTVGRWAKVLERVEMFRWSVTRERSRCLRRWHLERGGREDRL